MEPNNKLTSFFEYKLSKGDLTGAINLSLLEAELAKKIAQKAVNDLDANEKRLRALADEALAKYPTNQSDTANY